MTLVLDVMTVLTELDIEAVNCGVVEWVVVKVQEDDLQLLSDGGLIEGLAQRRTTIWINQVDNKLCAFQTVCITAAIIHFVTEGALLLDPKP